jgi:3-methyl-2-oxobutanoate hydroxymethyltransferase
MRNAARLIQEGGAAAVKIEGGMPVAETVRRIVEAGIPVMGHIGLTPQSATLLGGYRAQGRTAAAARRLVEEAVALERSGCFAIVLEAIPAAVAERVTEAVRIPTIGIGAGPACSGQVLVWHDLLGLTEGPTPRFVKRYAELGAAITDALKAYADDVRRGTFPGETHTYGMPDAEREQFEARLGASRTK